MIINIKFLRTLVALLALTLLVMILGRGIFGYFQQKAECSNVMDIQGHCPDEGSEEWWRSCYHQMLVGSWVKREKGEETESVEEGFTFLGNRSLELMSASKTGDNWELIGDSNTGMGIRFWIRTASNSESESNDYDILKITPYQLLLKLKDGDTPIPYKRLDTDK